MRLSDMRTVAALRDAAPAPDEVERLSDRQLYAAAANPDHSEAGRNAAAEALRARGFEPLRWRLRASSFIRAHDLERGQALFFGLAPTFAGAARGLALAALVGAVALMVLRLPGSHALLGLACLAALAHAVAVVFRARPARVAVLRRPVLRGFAAPARRLLARELRPFGHVAALGPAHGLAEPAIVWRARDYRRLARQLGHRVRMNLRTLVTTAETIAVRPSRAWRPMTLRLLADSADVVVVDLSCPDAGAEQDLAFIRDAGVAQKTVFIAIWGWVDRAEALLRACGFAHDCHFYAPDGEMQRRAGFRAAMLNAIRAAHDAAP